MIVDLMNEKWLYAANIVLSRFINAGRRSLPKQIRSVMVVKWDEIGDMASAVHIFDLVKKAHPQAEITVLCKPFVATLIENHPAIFKVITRLEDWKMRYDIVVELRGTWGTLLKSFHWSTGPKYRLDRGWIRFRQRGNQPHEILTNYRIALPLIGPESGAILAVEALMKERKLYPSVADRTFAEAWKCWALAGCSRDVLGYAILHTGARNVLRRWSSARYAELSKWLLAEKKLIPIWVGTPEEQVQIKEVIEYGGEGKVWISGVTQPTSAALLSFFAFIQQASLYVGNESGPLQLADIAEIPLVAIYGPGVPRVFYPLSKGSCVLHEVLACNPCNQVVCSQPPDRCIDRIALTSVKLAVDQVLGSAESFVQKTNC